MSVELGDLRPVLADILDGLADADPFYVRGARWVSPDPASRMNRLRRGAATLRWCAEREMPSSVQELQEDVARLTEEAETRDARFADLVDMVRDEVNGWAHADGCPAGGAPANGPCHCALKARRDALLAVAEA